MAEIDSGQISLPIPYSKLNLSNSILTSDILSTEFNVANKLLKLDAGALTPTAQLGSGTPDATKFLRGDQSWQVLVTRTILSSTVSQLASDAEAGTASVIAGIMDGFVAGLNASIFNDASLTVAKAASIIDVTYFSSTKIKSTLENTNIGGARLTSILILKAVTKGVWLNRSINLNTAKWGVAGFGTLNAGASAGGILAAGGVPTNQTELFNGSTWTNSGNLNTQRAGAGAFGTQSAGVACGGYTDAVGTSTNKTELFNGSTWSNSGNLNNARRDQAGFGTQSAGVSCGGYNGGTVSNKTELFNGSTWSNTGNLNTARQVLGAFGTQSAGVSCGGGDAANNPLANAELFNGSTWANTGSLNTAKTNTTGFGIQSAGVNCGGAINVGGTPTPITELFNGLTWSNSGNLNTSRSFIGSFGVQTAGVSMGGDTTGAGATTKVTEIFI